MLDLPPSPPKNTQRDNTTINVIIYDHEKKLYREMTHNFILRLEATQVYVIGKLVGSEVVPLTAIDIDIAEAMHLIVENGKYTKCAKRT